MHPYERFAALKYLRAVLSTKAYAHPPRSNADLHRWLEAHGRALGLPVFAGAETGSDHLHEHSAPRSPTRAGTADESWQNWRAAVLETGKQAEPKSSPLQRRLNWLAESCGLGEPQRAILELVARLAYNEVCAELLAAVHERLHCNLGNGAFDIDDLKPALPNGLAMDHLFNRGLAARFGLITVDQSGALRLSTVVHQMLSVRRLRAKDVRTFLLGAPQTATLAWEDFEHIATRDLALRIADAGGDGGMANILIYGPPGTGKSEFAKTLGAQLGRAVHFIGEKDSAEAEPDRRERVAALVVANGIGAATGKMIVVVDEADDVFAGVDEKDATARHGSKVFMNRLVETTRVPTIWITNDLPRLGPAVIRRMNLIIRFPKPSEAVRRKLVERLTQREKVVLDAEALGKMARLPAAPALLENAIRSVARIGGSGDDALRILTSSLRAMGPADVIALPAPIPFDASLSHADVDLCTLTAQLKASPERALSICLAGPPGTGKSAYARHLAAEMGLDVVEKRYSDLTSAFLGESEKAIASAFEEAADLGAFLIIDEADSLLRDRSAARQSWEVTQVNEMLTAMERHPGPFACSTNMPELLDPATVRRFLFKVRFLPLPQDRVFALFRRSFGAAAPLRLGQAEHLTPGDFAVVLRRAKILNETNPERLADALLAEVAAKPESRNRPIGFGTRA